VQYFSDKNRSTPLLILYSLLQIWEQRRLCAVLVRQDLQARYVGSVLGGLWTLLLPLLMLAVYTLVFGQILQTKWPQAQTSSSSEFVATLLAGMMVVSLFVEVGSRATGLLQGHANLIKKVRFPIQLLPVMLVCVALVNTMISALLLAVLQVLALGSLHNTWWALPLILLPVVLLSMACAWWVSATVLYVRDVIPLVQTGLSALFFLTPVFYPLSAVPKAWQQWLALNPLALAVEQTRAALIYGVQPDWLHWTVSLATAMVLALLGLWWFERLREGFADVL
jgi:lipopolysaccharide transport system permease protein